MKCVSMPSSGLIHFYKNTNVFATVNRVVSMPSSGLIHFYVINILISAC